MLKYYGNLNPKGGFYSVIRIFPCNLSTSGSSSSMETLLWNGRKAGIGPFSGSLRKNRFELISAGS